MIPDLDVICFGEILWDVFPNKKTLGGAPLNVALRLASQEVQTAIISCVGTDKNGENAASTIKKGGVDTRFIASHQELKTGEVLVSVDDNGIANYTINQPVAWDAIPVTQEMVEAVKKAPYFVFGSLAARGAFNRSSLQILLSESNTKIFDINFRAPYYDISMVYELMQLADVVKLNDEELVEVCDALGCNETKLEDRLRWLKKVTNTDTICVTQGSKGASLLHSNTFYKHPGFVVEVIDTVGAGDSFLAELISELFIKQQTPEKALETACAMGALVASKEGASCKVTKEEVLSFLE